MLAANSVPIALLVMVVAPNTAFRRLSKDTRIIIICVVGISNITAIPNLL